MKRTIVTLVALLVAAGCGGQRGSDTAPAARDGGTLRCEVTNDTRISIATGNTTGVYYALGGAYAEAISNSGGKLKATAAETGASVQNIEQLVAGDYQVAFSLADTAADAVNGTGAFAEKQPVAALARIYSNFTHVIVRTDSGITTMADMAGKRISTGSPKSGTEVIANRLLQAAGLNPDSDVAAQRLDLAKTVDVMKDGSIDGMVWSGGLPTPAILDLFTTARGQVRFIDVSPLLDEMQELSTVYAPDTIPAATYSTDANVPTILVPNVLLVRNDLDAGTACVLTKILFEKRDDLIRANAAARGIALEQAADTDPVPLHPGARKALTDLGAG